MEKDRGPSRTCLINLQLDISHRNQMILGRLHATIPPFPINEGSILSNKDLAPGNHGALPQNCTPQTPCIIPETNIDPRCRNSKSRKSLSKGIAAQLSRRARGLLRTPSLASRRSLSSSPEAERAVPPWCLATRSLCTNRITRVLVMLDKDLCSSLPMLLISTCPMTTKPLLHSTHSARSPGWSRGLGTLCMLTRGILAASIICIRANLCILVKEIGFTGLLITGHCSWSRVFRSMLVDLPRAITSSRGRSREMPGLETVLAHSKASSMCLEQGAQVSVV